MTGHSAHSTKPSRWTGKFAWDCSPCGAWSGFRYKTAEGAERGATKHNLEAAEIDRKVHQRLYGGKR